MVPLIPIIRHFACRRYPCIRPARVPQTRRWVSALFSNSKLVYEFGGAGLLFKAQKNTVVYPAAPGARRFAKLEMKSDEPPTIADDVDYTASVRHAHGVSGRTISNTNPPISSKAVLSSWSRNSTLLIQKPAPQLVRRRLHTGGHEQPTTD
jgi:hypothetical protein